MTAGITVRGARRVRLPLRRPLATAVGATATIDAWLLRLVDPDGRVGIGEANLGPGADEVTRRRLDELVHREVGRVVGVPVGPSSEAPVDPAAAAVRAAVAAALVDLGRLLADRPRAETVPVNALVGAETTAGSVKGAEAAVADGSTTLKLKAGDETMAALVARLDAVRSVVGPEVRLRLDVNGAWDPATAEAALRVLEPLDLELVEQPVADSPGVAEIMARLRQRCGIRLAADESVTSVATARALLDADAVDALVVKPARVGGPDVALAIADVAAHRGVAVIVSTLLETGVGLRTGLVTAAMLPAPEGPGAPGERAALAHGLGTGSLVERDLVRRAVAVVDGHATPPHGPGLGLDRDLDAAVLDGSTVELVGEWP